MAAHDQAPEVLVLLKSFTDERSPGAGEVAKWSGAGLASGSWEAQVRPSRQTTKDTCETPDKSSGSHNGPHYLDKRAAWGHASPFLT